MAERTPEESERVVICGDVKYRKGGGVWCAPNRSCCGKPVAYVHEARVAELEAECARIACERANAVAEVEQLRKHDSEWTVLYEETKAEVERLREELRRMARGRERGDAVRRTPLKTEPRDPSTGDWS